MPVHLTFLGTSGAIPSLARDTTSLVVVADEGAILLDCGGSPLQKLLLARVDPARLTHVVLTHMHPDHAYGLPSLLQNLYLLGRRAPLPVFCPRAHVESVGALLDIFRLRRDGLVPVAIQGIEPREREPVFTLGPLVVTTSPNEHGTMPNVAVRVDGPPRGGVVYSSDTTPCDAVVRLATGAHTLIHESTFPHRDRGRFGAHSTAAEAGQIAARAGVERLLLIHIEADYHGDLGALAAEAGEHFGGTVEVAEEFTPYPL
jgi:ribonuclease Z